MDYNNYFSDPILLHIFSFLKREDLAKTNLVCRRWSTVSKDDILWKKLLMKDFQVDASSSLKTGSLGWRREYQRLYDETPVEICNELRAHDDEVLHVNFSHSGETFVTCSKDGHFMTWEMDLKSLKTNLRKVTDMRTYDWHFTWASKYNQDDSLLLVAGVVNDVHGKIAIFDCVSKEQTLLAMVDNAPYDVMGAWCDSRSFLHGRMSPYPNFDATIHLCRLSTSREGEEESSMTHNILLKFGNRFMLNASYLRCLTICDRSDFSPDPQFPSTYEEMRLGAGSRYVTQEGDPHPSAVSTLQTAQLCLVFLCSSKTGVPHELGFKRLWPQDLLAVPTLHTPDHTIELHGHVVGIHQERTGRYLFVNVRRWAEDAEPSEERPPSICQDVDLVMVDLKTLSIVEGQVFRGHKGFTPTLEAFYLYLDTSEDLVGSGSENCEAILWDRTYTCQVAKLKHDACVNSVAFHPKSSEVLISVSDDKVVKVWKSRNLARNIPEDTSPIQVMSIN